MLFGAIGMCGSMIVLAITSWAADPIVGRDSQPAAIVAAVFLFVFNSFFAVGWLGMTLSGQF